MPNNYENIIDAISKTVNGNPNGLSSKQIAMELWPDRSPDTARSVLSRALNSENADVNLKPEELVRIMEITERPWDIIYFLCDHFGYDRPKRKTSQSFEQEILRDVERLKEQLAVVVKKIDFLDNVRKNSNE